MKILALVTASLIGLMSGGPLVAQAAVSRTNMVAPFVVHEIMKSRPKPVALFFGLPRACFEVESGLCKGREFASSAREQVQTSVRQVAASFSKAESVDADAEARESIADPVGDSATPRNRWYRVCAAQEVEQGDVVIVRPSAVRETVSGSEWRVVVTLASYPRRGECYGYASAREYIVVGAPETSTGFKLKESQFIGGATGRIK